MKTLKCNGKEILIEDFFLDKRICTIDAKFNLKEEFENFASIYREHSFGKGIFQFEIDDNFFNGWFGQMLYDKNYNVRVCVGIYIENEDMQKRQDGRVYSVERSLIGIGNAIRDLCKILKSNDIFDEEVSNRIIDMMNTPETMEEFSSLVYDLPLYLKERNDTMDELRG